MVCFVSNACRYLMGQVEKRTLEKYEREAKEKNRESWLVCCSISSYLNRGTILQKTGSLCFVLSVVHDVYGMWCSHIVVL